MNHITQQKDYIMTTTNTTNTARYTADRSAVLCEHCDTHIEVGTDYAVQLYFPEDTEKSNPIGPYCPDCMGKLKVCCGCNKAYFGEDISYFQKGIYYCKECVDTKEMCSMCGTLKDLKEVDGKRICTSCFDEHYRTCGVCGDTKGVEGFSNSTNLIKAQFRGAYKKHTHICNDCFESTLRGAKEYEVYECKNCGKVHGTNSPYCEECQSNLSKCSICGKVHHKLEDKMSRGNYVLVCPDCKPNRCESCGFLTNDTLKQTTGIFGSVMLCDQCEGKQQCKSCLRFDNVGDDGLCGNCNGIFNETCDTCGTVVRERGTQCFSCSQSSCYISDYNYKPSPLFHYTSKDVKDKAALFLGFENEIVVECSEKKAIFDMYKHFDHTELIVKSDSTIHGPGFEIVSHPFTLDAIHKKDWFSTIKHAKDDKSCGMHVHFNRSALRSDVHLYKIVQFIHENEQFADVIAGRKYTGYQKKLEGKASRLVKNKEGSRYQRVNLNNRDTIEIRMFANATRVYQLMNRLEFVHALVKYTENASIKSCRRFAGFITFVKMNKKEYPQLHKFLSGAPRFWNK